MHIPTAALICITIFGLGWLIYSMYCYEKNKIPLKFLYAKSLINTYGASGETLFGLAKIEPNQDVEDAIILYHRGAEKTIGVADNENVGKKMEYGRTLEFENSVRAALLFGSSKYLTTFKGKDGKERFYSGSVAVLSDDELYSMGIDPKKEIVFSWIVFDITSIQEDIYKLSLNCP